MSIPQKYLIPASSYQIVCPGKSTSVSSISGTKIQSKTTSILEPVSEIPKSPAKSPIRKSQTQSMNSRMSPSRTDHSISLQKSPRKNPSPKLEIYTESFSILGAEFDYYEKYMKDLKVEEEEEYQEEEALVEEEDTNKTDQKDEINTEEEEKAEKQEKTDNDPQNNQENQEEEEIEPKQSPEHTETEEKTENEEIAKSPDTEEKQSAAETEAPKEPETTEKQPENSEKLDQETKTEEKQPVIDEKHEEEEEEDEIDINSEETKRFLQNILDTIGDSDLDDDEGLPHVEEDVNEPIPVVKDNSSDKFVFMDDDDINNDDDHKDDPKFELGDDQQVLI